MKDKLLNLGKHSIVYGIGNALTAAGGFILIPFYTNMLSTSDYGILELLNRTADILILIIMLGIRQAFVRFYFDQDNDEWRKEVLGTTTVFLIVSSLIVLILFWPLKEWLAGLLFNDPIIAVFFIYIIVWIPLELILRTGLTHLQIQMKSTAYVIINFFKFFTFIASNIILIYYFNMGILGVLVTNIWISAIIGIGFLIKIYGWTRFKVSKSLLKKLVIFGLPYLPTTIFGYIINNSDRYFLTIYSNLDEVGIYALGFKIGMFGLSLIMEPFGKVWSPFLFDNFDKADGPQLITKVFTINAAISFAAALAISVAAPIVVPLISEKSYHEAYKLIPYICLASVFYGMASMADYGILISKKTIYKPFIFGSAALVTIVANFILVPLYAGKGAAIALVIAFFVLLVINFIASNKFYHISLEFRKLFLIAFVAVIVFFISDFIINVDPKSIFYQGLSVLSFILYPIFLWIGGLLSKEEKKVFLMLINRKKKK